MNLSMAATGQGDTNFLEKAGLAAGALLVVGPLLYYSELEQPIDFALANRWDSSLFFFIVGAFTETAIRRSRHQARLSHQFRVAMGKTDFFTVRRASPNVASKVTIMKQLFSAFPSTVSEMVHVNSSQHSRIFNALLTVAGSFALLINFDHLTPSSAAGLSGYIMIFNRLRYVSMVVGCLGFPLVPSPEESHGLDWKGVMARDGEEMREKMRRASRFEMRETIMRTSSMEALHANFAMSLLLVFPVLQLLEMPREIYILLMATAAGDIGSNDVAISVFWLSQALVHLFGLITILMCFKVFIAHFANGDVMNPDKGYKVFWMEYSVAFQTTQTLQVAALSTFFDVNCGHQFHSLPLMLKLLIVPVAANCTWKLFRTSLPAFRLALRDMEYTDKEYVLAFNKWKAEEAVMQATIDEAMDSMQAAKHD